MTNKIKDRGHVGAWSRLGRRNNKCSVGSRTGSWNRKWSVRGICPSADFGESRDMVGRSLISITAQRSSEWGSERPPQPGLIPLPGDAGHVCRRLAFTAGDGCRRRDTVGAAAEAQQGRTYTLRAVFCNLPVSLNYFTVRSEY